MRKKLPVLLCYILLSSLARGGDGEFAAARIPAQLLVNANAVVRIEEERAVLKNLEKMIITHRYVITILNEKGNEYADWVEMYDKFNSIESIEGTLYDALGKKLRAMKKSEIRDLSMTSDMTMVQDGRLKAHNFYYRVYPYTVEYIVETAQKETMFFPKWIPLKGENVAVEKSSLAIQVPADYQLRYKAFNYDQEPAITAKDQWKEYSWAITAYPAVVREFASPGWRGITPVIMTAPSDFVIDGYKGRMTEWNELGSFTAMLNKGRDVLPEPVKQKVHELIKGARSVQEKVARLYQYLQNNTRYVGIQLGIGGWQPFDANYVSANAYGDCKALSNYMYSLLKEAGIPSYYTLIRAGDDEEDIVVDFPSSQFNHVIICVPNEKEMIWLECTSQTVSPGYMGDFTGDRHALMITESGGKLVETPKYSVRENRQVRRIKASLNSEGFLEVHAVTSYSGVSQDFYHSLIHNLSKEKVKEYLGKQLDFATYDVDVFNYTEEKGLLPSVGESLDISVKNYATITGKRLFINPNVMTRSYRKLSLDTARKYDIRLSSEYADIDSVEIDLPAGYQPESMPQDVTVTTPFGKYQSSVRLKGDKLQYFRSIEQYRGSFPAKDYNDLAKFYESIYRADHSRVVLIAEATTLPAKAF